MRTAYAGSARGYRLLDEHGCIVAFNLRLSNLYEVLKLRKLETLVLFTHAPNLLKLDFMLRALGILRPRFVTISEVF